MAAVPLIIPALTTDDGTPVSGALIAFKRKGTSTNQVAYLDEGLTTPSQNPEPCDAGGRQVLYLDGSKNYDVTVKSADSATTYLSITFSAQGDTDDSYTPDAYDVPDDGITDGLAETEAWLSAAAAAGYWADGLGKTIALSDTLDISTYTGLKLRDVTFKLLNPNTTSRIGVYTTGNDNVHFQRVKVNRNGDGTSGAITTSHAFKFDSCDNAIMEDCEGYGNNKGNAFYFTGCNNPRIIRASAHDIRYVHAAETDDQVQGIWFDACAEGVVTTPYVKNLGRTDSTSSSRDRFSRGLVFSGCRDFEVDGGFYSRLDQAIDITGSNGNNNITINAPDISYVASNGVKFANTAIGCSVNGGVIEHFGLTGVLFSGPDAPLQNMTQDNKAVGVLLRNGGANGIHSASSVRGVSWERNSAGSPENGYPKGCEAHGVKVVSDEGNSTFTVYSTDTLALAGYIPISRGVRCRLTTSGVIPTGLATATDYYLIPVVGQSRVQLASSYNNAIDGTAVTGISGGSGTQTLTLFSNLYDPFYENTTTKDATRPNRAIDCSGAGYTNKQFNGVFVGPHNSFSARLSADIDNQTGDSTTYDIVWDTEIYDPSGSFNNATGIYTSKVTAPHIFTATVTIDDIAAGHDRIFLSITTSNRDYQQDFGDVPADANGRIGLSLTCIADMDEGDTAKVQILVGGSTKVIDIKSGSLSSFQGAALS